MQNKDLLEELESFSSKKRINRKFIYIAIAIVSFLAIVLFFIFNGNDKSNKIEYITKKVTQGDLSVVVSTTGNLNPTNSVEIGIEVSGTLKEIFVDFNDEVKAGQILAKIDTVKLQSQVDSSTAALAIAVANQKESQVLLNNKKTLYDRTLNMYKNSGGKYPSKNELDDTRFSYEAAIESLEAAKAKVLQAQSNLKTDKQNLEKASVKSSIDGIVLNREVEVGQTLAATMSAPKLFTIAKDLTNMDLIVSIDEADVADIKKDLPVTFTVDAYPNKVFNGKVKQVRLNPVDTNGVVTYETVVSVDNEDLLLKPGMTATAKIITKESKNKLLIPNGALRFKPKMQEQKNGGVNLVGPNMNRPANVARDLSKKELAPIFILENNQPKRVMVKVLDSDGKLTSIESEELKVDDEVIISQKSDDGK
ncbi:efflux RND transporter periplasmic adaptor subunit [Aliarcobacter butzleri]|uniref:Efflux RND transporter periplasmic adaptor subunit n=2 Tax=Aliarcobacter butzleri TaxID=28197 RepID=A0AAP4UZ07_9BACT|nr:efflux RND transporter periplasmic adaptor subunit [Aliarcobacter butzleri]MCT7633106.1 efflux RND transporter periplasmic adaptor subunit [Aliarcobacter butzleri]MDN5052616.1 efflux RND transporter periplasmic adaptor subunit [Aliarcobacter butzleri]MDN5075131.1 efflux RND transporter periplasmic adaptor subunit [Aliarcobacter butzleri]MDN5117125.1 efflux RND transporter periplasmic adaptor subunit [Aliarcobacter butzleri]MDN5132858.1 efflux RND transporter periplasmic adaptor subunit [Ali